MPEIIHIWRRVQKYGHMYAGGIADQPHILLLELDECEAAYKKFQAHRAFLEGQVLNG